MKTIKFLVASILQDYRVGTPDEESYAVDQIVTLPDDKAKRWIKRNRAVEVTEPVASPPTPQEKPPPEEPEVFELPLNPDAPPLVEDKPEDAPPQKKGKK